jgi:hypothetical protein
MFSWVAVMKPSSVVKIASRVWRMALLLVETLHRVSWLMVTSSLFCFH